MEILTVTALALGGFFAGIVVGGIGMMSFLSRLNRNQDEHGNDE